MLGLKVDARVPATGPAVEYLLGLTGSTTADTLLVLTKRDPQPGSTSFGRIIFVVPDGRRMAARVVAGGGRADRIVDGVNIVRDPDGNVIELYQRPAPKPPG